LRRPKLTSLNSLTILQELDDGYYRVKHPQGRIAVLRLTKCVECDSWMTSSRSKLCFYCAADARDKAQKDALEAGAQRRRVANLEVAVKRRAAKMGLASPKWRDKEKIKAIYEEARRRTAETGIKYHVDHIYPLQGDLCSGLHVHHNLRIITASENCSKHNGHPMHESPALVSFVKQYGESGFYRWLRWFKSEMKFKSSGGISASPRRGIPLL
jgi:hypothetical protein